MTALAPRLAPDRDEIRGHCEMIHRLAAPLRKSAFTAAPVCARQRVPRRMLAGGPKERTH